MMSGGKYALLSVQLIGAAIALCFVAVTFLSPDEVEVRLHAFAQDQVEAAAQGAFDDIAGQFAESDGAERPGALAERFGEEAEAILADRDMIISALMQFVLWESCGAPCGGTAAISGVLVDSALVNRAAQFHIGQATAIEFIAERYEASVAGLMSDLRRFGLVTAIALLLSAGLTLFRNVLDWRFGAFSTALTGYTTWAGYGYLFSQDWALSILLQDWAAPGYQVGMLAVSLVLADWLFLNGFVTKAITKAIASILPS